ncbi:deaminase domain-containing protein [Paenibacillus alginolyticus]|uniref:CMP/dCMP-type deaminase domain-containing protein n=1 Tax=Paenibacillus alginolyticus TaxID=59839 RepID=A0ABT4GJR0_9BACL|nr:deaminase domain-containing protein [Paenibacillus alginolyticus]MCY9696440.1 hypothetical protein [Paenibacillus alginolyticus]MEC0145277.1 deaminase domain-containing protein [Paenibacillus alginolyticus]
MKEKVAEEKKGERKLGICRKIKYDSQIAIANKLRTLAFNQAKDALIAKYKSGVGLGETKKYNKIKNGGANIGALIIGDVEFAACSAVQSEDYIYNDFFVTNTPDVSNVLHVTANRDINYSEGWTREEDSEAKLLWEIENNYNYLLNSHQVIDLYTYFQPCLSCDYYIINFLKKNIKIDINIYYESNYPDGKRYLIEW